MREWTSLPRNEHARHHDCMAAFFIIMGALVFAAALLCALGYINLMP